MELDHVFLISGYEGVPWIDRLTDKGLVETYRRTHHGQGTANVCFAFDNAFIELLWITDPTEARSEPIARTRLFERANGGCPIGIAWRGETDSRIALWEYRPPYLTDGLSIPVAKSSDDPGLPMLFQSPGRLGPAHWTAERRGALQQAANFRRLQLILHTNGPPTPDLAVLAKHSILTINQSHRWAVELRAHGDGGLVTDVLST